MASRIEAAAGALTPYGPGGHSPACAGMPLTGDPATGIAVARSGSFTLDSPVVFGAPTDTTFTPWAAVRRTATCGGRRAPSAGRVSLLGTVRMTSIEIIGPDGQPLCDFTITAGSGPGYDSHGVLAERAGFLLMAAGLASPAAAARRACARSSPARAGSSRA